MSGNFINAHQGWIATTSGQCAGCISLSRTVDGGAQWEKLPQPPVEPVDSGRGVPSVYFLNADTGFLFGGKTTWQTNDGGQRWTRTTPTFVSRVLASGGFVYAFSAVDAVETDPPSLWRTPIGTDAWTKLTLPAPNMTGHATSWSLTTQGNVLALLQAGFFLADIDHSFPPARLWSSTDGGSTWNSRTVPCTDSDGGAAVMSIALGHPQAWLVDCYNGQQSQQAQDTKHHLYGSADGGSTWVRLADPSQHGDPDLLVDNGAGHAFLATESGGQDALRATFDNARSWKTVLIAPHGAGFLGWAELQFFDSHTGFVIEQNPTTAGIIYRTTDGGQTWQKITTPHL